MRQDEPDGAFESGDDDLDTLRDGTPEHGSDDSKEAPPVSHEPSQDDDDAERQEENAETSQDQPSS
jgi:hypothetical protein